MPFKVCSIVLLSRFTQRVALGARNSLEEEQ